MWKIVDLQLNLVELPNGKWSNGYTIKDGMVFDPDTDSWNELYPHELYPMRTS